MKTIPDIETVKRYAKSGEYGAVPVCAEMLSDGCTPITVLKTLKSVSKHCYLLESAQPQETWGRYSFLGYDPLFEVTCAGGRVYRDGKPVGTGDPAAYLRGILAEYKSPRLPGFPPFTGGFTGYFSYDYIKYGEPSIGNAAEDEEGFRDVDLMLFDKVIAFDNLRQKIVITVNIPLNGDVEKAYAAAGEEIARTAALVRANRECRECSGRMLGEITPLFSKERYCEMVETAKRRIREGDIFQIVLSNRFGAPFEGSLLNAYRLLRAGNPSPYMFYFYGTDVEVAGASPETLVKLENGVLHTFPLAGTRPRGATEEEDAALERELKTDEKELAEHNMLVDLGRNDLGRISEFGTVRVEKLREVEKFSHVMHLGSTVRGEIRKDCDALDAIAAVLPAGTLSGAPKIRACSLIEELERSKRGIYGGAIGYIDFNGNADTCIAIRIAYHKNGRVFVRSGAGIVADSVPENEYNECVNKAKAVIGALRGADGAEL